ncbi:MAG TPA: hypothetical protein VMH02_08200 [Verrucomicrobiae bacterium]|nr:hypothetical protein [Verrucomicrobiae bacterium]
MAALDGLLGGGFPWGMLVVLEGRAGRWSIAARLLAEVTRGGLAAVIDDGSLYPPSLDRAGVRLDRLLVVPAAAPLGVARAADILIRSRACKLVVLPAVPLRDAVWMRLASLAHRAGVIAIAIAAQPGTALAAAAGLRVHCALERAVLCGTRGLWCTFAGFELRAELRKHKRAVGAHANLWAVDAPAGAPVRERGLALVQGGRRAALR